MIDLTLHMEGTTRFTICVGRFVLKNHRNGYRQALGMSALRGGFKAQKSLRSSPLEQEPRQPIA